MKIPTEKQHPTLIAIDRAIETDQDKSRRSYLGMSSIGDGCSRKLWYNFRWAIDIVFDAASLKRFEDGQNGEDVQAARLRKLEFITLWTHKEDGSQFGATEHNGHFKGHADGFILGILEAPKTWHVWEHKQSAEKKQKELTKLINADEKNALEKWSPIYFAQGLLYMHYFKMNRHYLTCATPGGRHTISVRTDANQEKAQALIEKALIIIRSQTAPEKLSESPAYFECKWCDYYGLCHGEELPNINCRTCVHSTPELEGTAGRWSCARYGKDISVADQRKACGQHMFIPTLLRNHAEATDSDGKNWVSYSHREEKTPLINGEGGLSSEDLIKHLEIPF